MTIISGERVAGIRARFFKFVSVQPGSCWLWTGGTAGGRAAHQRYGLFRPTWVKGDRKHWYAHRVSYVLHKGPIPEGFSVIHTCDVPLCVNPAHLSLGTPRDNAADKVAKGRQTTGSGNGGARLTEADIPRILAMRSGGARQREIAAVFGVSRATVSFILNGKAWTAITRASETVCIVPDETRGRHAMSSVHTQGCGHGQTIEALKADIAGEQADLQRKPH